MPGTLWTWTDIIPRPAYLPSGLPEDLVYRLDKLNSQHSSWWVGQVYQFALKFALKLTPFAQKAINDTMNKLNFKQPIVAVQGSSFYIPPVIPRGLNQP